MINTLEQVTELLVHKEHIKDTRWNRSYDKAYFRYFNRFVHSYNSFSIHSLKFSAHTFTAAKAVLLFRQIPGSTLQNKFMCTENLNMTFRFSWWWIWRLISSGVWHRTDCWIIRGIRGNCCLHIQCRIRSYCIPKVGNFQGMINIQAYIFLLN